MKNRWQEQEARKFRNDPLALRVYTSRLLGQDPNLVLQGGGNTSVKMNVTNLFGESEEVLYVKGSGWDLATIERQGFAPVKLDLLKRMARLKHLSDTEMVKNQRAAMTDPSAPNPSVEAILHAIIPFQFVDHTHADSVVAVSNTKNGETRIREIYGRDVLIVPYVMPGFILARKVFEMTRGIDWQRLKGLVLLHHGIFTFADDAKASYTRMIRLVTKAEDYLKKKRAAIHFTKKSVKEDLLQLAGIRRIVSRVRGGAVIAKWNPGDRQVAFANHPEAGGIATRGPLTPDHVIRTKRIPVIVDQDPEKDIERFASEYRQYFIRQNRTRLRRDRHAAAGLKALDPAPRWAVWPGYGTISFGTTLDEANIINDITEHTINAILAAEKLGGWQALPEKDIFEIEYWELEQAKLNKSATAPVFQGKVALVTGAASGIGKACVETLCAQGAVVAALDIDAAITKIFKQPEVLGIICDVTKPREIEKAVSATVRRFGGLDILVSNAGIFPPSATISQMERTSWQKSLDINLTSHQVLMKTCIPYLELGIDPAIVIIASKNVPAPGPGAGAYSVAKAGLTQLARVAALELAAKNIRVNVVHPNQVFDTALWTPKILEARARHYKMSVPEYKTSNLLKTEITSKDVANLVCAMAGPVFGKTTGAQVPIDGGNERVI
ncbi:MAG: bifunctional aldolase/short-chain dehydrogenase [Candidatus Omnitrophica bacterium]|nr:bifunctional aldolase/short-chain dehydrogenase [Candidatus Omnitrophota bacterium]